METNAFDIRAASWDTPERVARTLGWAEAIGRAVPLTGDSVVVDYGAGTGLLALALSSRVREVLALDSSAGMLEKLNEKCREYALGNVKAARFDIETQPVEPGCCDVFVACVTLHHLRDPDQFARAALQALRPGGHLAVIDLDYEGGEFHEDHSGVHHHGFIRDELGQRFAAAGFEAVRFEDVPPIRKQARSGGVRDFPVFLMVAQKPHAKD